MLQPAQLYEAELQEENIKSWYKPENIYWQQNSSKKLRKMIRNKWEQSKTGKERAD